MGLKHHPRVVTNGLVFYVDAANTRSYAGSGNTIYSLSGASNPGALTNGPAYSSSNNGIITFDGTNDYIVVNNSADILSKTAYTKTAYVYFTSFSTSNNMISGGNSSQHAFWLSGSNRLYAGHNGAWTTVTGGSTLSLNTWYFAAVTYDNSSGWKLYLNGVQDGTNANTTTFTGSQFINIASYDAGNYLTGRMGVIQVYNRVLTAQEILQNYNATKTRYGL